jgi:predicted nucleic acid-binding protein
LIWYLRGREEARKFLESIAPSRRFLPAIVVMELTRGCRNRSELRRLRGFLDSGFAGVVHISEEISRRAMALVDRYALSHRLTLDDALVAGSALTVRAPLATGNLAAYRFVSDLAVAPFRLRS